MEKKETGGHCIEVEIMKKKTSSGIDFEAVRNTCDSIRKEIGKVVVGYEDVIDDFLVCMITQSHMFMLGIPGVAKTTLAKTFSAVTGLSWNRVQFTQDLLPSDIIGHYYFNQKINRSPAKVQSALLEAMQEKQVTIEGTTLELPRPFMVIATKNPVETEGVYPLPEAQLDRFLYRVNMDYLESDLELEMLRRKSENNDSQINVVGRDFVKKLVGMHHKVYADESILKYILNILAKTRSSDMLVLGGSPRAGEHLLYAAKAYTLIHGRDYVIPDYVKKVVPNVLGHRLILSAESELEGLSSDKVVDDILDSVEVPDVLSPQLVAKQR